MGRQALLVAFCTRSVFAFEVVLLDLKAPIGQNKRVWVEPLLKASARSA
jgi:hypothetical protein